MTVHEAQDVVERMAMRVWLSGTPEQRLSEIRRTLLEAVVKVGDADLTRWAQGRGLKGPYDAD